MWARKAFKMVVRPLSALSLVVPMFGVLGACNDSPQSFHSTTPITNRRSK